jgi:hypothetical protein
MAANTMHVTLDILNLPELIATLRCEMAARLRSLADGEPEFVRRKFNDAAALFEIGATTDPTDD